jgi:acetyl esterase
MPTTTEHALTAADFDFRVRVYPAAKPTGPVLVWLHGGSYMFGTIDMPEADEVGRKLSDDGVTVVSVDYTLAPLDGLKWFPQPDPADGGPTPEEAAAYLAAAGPRSPYPTAVTQTVAAVSWARDNASTWSGDPAQVSIGGASAGATIAAGAAVRLRDAGHHGLASLLLVYPLLHPELPKPDAELQAFLDAAPAGSVLSAEAIRGIAECYLGGASADDVYAFPGGHDMRGMPRTFIVNAERDQLRLSGEAFAAELARGGVDVDLVREPGTDHGYLNVIGDPAAGRTLARMRRVLTEPVH